MTAEKLFAKPNLCHPFSPSSTFFLWKYVVYTKNKLKYIKYGINEYITIAILK